MTTQELMALAKQEALSGVPDEQQRNLALNKMADALVSHTDEILKANEQDCAASKDSLSEVMMDRLKLTAERIQAMADGVRAVAALPDPLGRVLHSRTLPNGLQVQRISVPMGVIGIFMNPARM
jgi:glutamate-5-semialdehyde dehydrogenase